MPERPVRTRPAWRVLRAVYDLADGAWTWRGSYEHISQIAKVPRADVAGHLRALAAEKALTIALRPRLGLVTVSWPPGSVGALMRLLRRIQPGEHRFPAPPPRCPEPDCELAAGHEFSHVSACHPVLRPGEVLRWWPAPPAPPAPPTATIAPDACCALTSMLGSASSPTTSSIVPLAPVSGDGTHL